MIPVAIVDTREPDPAIEPRAAFRPFFIPPGTNDRVFLNLVRKKLDAGDYSAPGLESVVAFERKTLQDLIGTLFGTRTNALGEGVSNCERFVAELERLRSFERRAIVVEDSIDAVRMHQYRSRTAPKTVLARLYSFWVDYDIPVIWAGSRAGAEHFVGTTLARIADQQLGGEAAKKARARGVAPYLPWIAKEESAA